MKMFKIEFNKFIIKIINVYNVPKITNNINILHNILILLKC